MIRNIRDIFFASMAVLMIVHGCGATAHEPCTDNDLRNIVLAHEARLASKCVGQGPNCAAREAENAEFDADLREWTRCYKKDE